MNNLLIFPTSRAIRKYISNNSHTNTLLPKLLSIDELFKNSINIKNKKYIDENLRIIYLKQAVDFAEFKNLGISTKGDEFWSQSDFIFRFLGELAHEDIDIESLNQYDTYVHYIDHIEILKIVKENYINILNKHNLVDKLNLPMNYFMNYEYIKSFDSIHIYLDGYLSKFEYTIISKISSINTIILEFDYNKFNQKSILQIDNDSLNLEENYKYIINLSSNKILEKTILNINKSNAIFYPFESRINQIAFIKQSIYDAVKIKKIQPEDIVVLLPDESFASYLKLFDKENYLKFAFGFDIFDTNIFKTINSIDKYLNDSNTQNNDLLKFLNIQLEDKLFIDIQKNWSSKISKDIIKIVNNLIEESNDKDDIKLSIKKTIFTLSNILIENNVNITIKEFFKIIIQKLTKLKINDLKGGKISVMGLLETRLISFKAVIVCDFNDHIIPQRSSKDKFLSTHIKELVSLPTSTNKQNLQAYYYNKLFQNSSHNYISYVQNDTSTISRFATQLLNIENKQISKDKEFQDILYIKNLRDNLNDNISLDIDLSKKIWSSSSFTRFLKCKRKYYLQDILRIKEHHFSIKPQGYELGNIIHTVLENIYKNNNNFSNFNTLYKAILDNLNTIKASNPYLIFSIELLKKKLQNFVHTDIKRFQQGIKVLECEKEFKFTHNDITITGSIDRIDIHKDGKLDILDYKTSKSLKIDTIKNYLKSTDFQLEFYFLALQSDKILNVCYYDLNKGQLLDETMLDEKLVLLDEKLELLKTTTVDFSKCEDLKECQYCPYITICKRD